jgi:hypothetical protein
MSGCVPSATGWCGRQAEFFARRVAFGLSPAVPWRWGPSWEAPSAEKAIAYGSLPVGGTSNPLTMNVDKPVPRGSLLTVVRFGRKRPMAGFATTLTRTGKQGPLGARRSPSLAHRHTCAPHLHRRPCASPSRSGYPRATPTFLLENHPGLDTPPPKRLT